MAKAEPRSITRPVVEHAAWHAPRGQRRAANKRYAEARAAERRFGDLEDDAMDRLVDTVPRTLEGAVAVLRYVRERYEQRHSMEEDELMALLASIEQAICGAAGLPAPSGRRVGKGAAPAVATMR